MKWTVDLEATNKQIARFKVEGRTSYMDMRMSLQLAIAERLEDITESLESIVESLKEIEYHARK